MKKMLPSAQKFMKNEDHTNWSMSPSRIIDYGMIPVIKGDIPENVPGAYKRVMIV